MIKHYLFGNMNKTLVISHKPHKQGFFRNLNYSGFVKFDLHIDSGKEPLQKQYF